MDAFFSMPTHIHVRPFFFFFASFLWDHRETDVPPLVANGLLLESPSFPSQLEDRPLTAVGHHAGHSPFAVDSLRVCDKVSRFAV